jgi:hypothetical protein
MCIICVDRRNAFELNCIDCGGCDRLSVLPFLPNLEILDCSRTNLKEINKESVPNLKILRCGGCRNLKRIDDIEGLEQITAITCGDLFYLPRIQSLKHLTINVCIKIKQIPFYPKLVSLRCGGCFLIKDFCSFPELQTMCCYNTEIRTLPRMDKLKTLDVSYCRKLTFLPEFPEIEQMNIVGCDSIFYIQNLDSVIRLCIASKEKVVDPMITSGAQSVALLINNFTLEQTSFGHFEKSKLDPKLVFLTIFRDEHKFTVKIDGEKFLKNFFSKCSEKQKKLFDNDEADSIIYHPDRFFDWTLDEEYKKEIRLRWN